MTKYVRMHGLTKTRREGLSQANVRKPRRDVGLIVSDKKSVHGVKQNSIGVVRVPIGGREKRMEFASLKTTSSVNHSKERAIGLLNGFQKNISRDNNLIAIESVDRQWRELLHNRDVVHYLTKLNQQELEALLDTLPIGCAKILAEVHPRMQRQIMGRWMEIEGHSIWEKIWNGVLKLLGKSTEVAGYIPTRVDRILNAPENERKSGLRELARWSMLAYYDGKLTPLAVLGGEHSKTHIQEQGLLEKITEKLGVVEMLDIFGLEILVEESVSEDKKTMHEQLKREVIRCAQKFYNPDESMNASIEVIMRVLSMRKNISNKNYDESFWDDLIHLANVGLLGNEIFTEIVNELEIELDDAVVFLKQKKEIFELEQLKSFDDLLLQAPVVLQKNDSKVAKQYVLDRVQLALRQGVVTAANQRSVIALTRMCGGLESGEEGDLVHSVLSRIDKRVEVQYQFEEWRKNEKTTSMFERGKNWLGKMVGWSSVDQQGIDAEALEKPDPMKSVTGTEGVGNRDIKSAQEFWSLIELEGIEEGQSEFFKIQSRLARMYFHLKYLSAHKTVRELKDKQLDDFGRMQLEIAEIFISDTQEQLRKHSKNKGWKEQAAVETMLSVPEDLEGAIQYIEEAHQKMLFQFSQIDGWVEYEHNMEQQFLDNTATYIERMASYGMHLHNAGKAVMAIAQMGAAPAAHLPILNGIGTMASTRELLAEWKRWGASGVLHENLERMMNEGNGFDGDLAAISHMVSVAQSQRGGGIKTMTAGLNIVSYASTVAVLLNPMDITIDAVGMDPLSMVMWASTIGAVAVGGGWSLYKYYRSTQHQAQVVTVRALDERLRILSGQINVTEDEKQIVRAQLIDYYEGDENFVDVLESDPLLMLAVQEKLDRYLLEHDPDYAIDEILGWINPDLKTVKDSLTKDEIQKRQTKIATWLESLGIFNPVMVQNIMSVGPANKNDVKDLLRAALNLA